jgi:Transcription factor WhiB
VAAHRARRGSQRRTAPAYLSISPADLPPQEPGWRSHPGRPCVGLTDLFFPPKSHARWMSARTDALCDCCPVFSSCVSYALLEGDAVYGRIACTAPGDRRAYRRRYGVKSPTMPSVESVITPIIEAIKLRRERQNGSNDTPLN